MEMCHVRLMPCYKQPESCKCCSPINNTTISLLILLLNVEKYTYQIKQQTSTSDDESNRVLIFATVAAPDEEKARLPDTDTVKEYCIDHTDDAEALAIDHQWTLTAGKIPVIVFVLTNGS